MAGEGKRRAKEPEERPAVPDGFELRKDGTVIVHLDGEMHRWRRPKIGELRKLREGITERDAKVAAVNAKAAAPGEGDEPIDPIREQEKIQAEWVEGAWRMLGDKEPPPSDEWPSGADQVGMMIELMKHWREVPLRSGA